MSQLAHSPTCGRWKLRDDDSLHASFPKLFSSEEGLAPILVQETSMCEQSGVGGAQIPPVGVSVEIPLSVVNIQRNLILKNQNGYTSNPALGEWPSDRRHSSGTFPNLEDSLTNGQPASFDVRRDLEHQNDIYFVESGREQINTKFTDNYHPVHLDCGEKGTNLNAGHHSFASNNKAREHKKEICTSGNYVSRNRKRSSFDSFSGSYDRTLHELASRPSSCHSLALNVDPPRTSVDPCCSSSADLRSRLNLPSSSPLIGPASRGSGSGGSRPDSVMLDKSNRCVWPRERDTEDSSSPVARKPPPMKEIPITEYIIQRIRRMISFNKKKGKI